MSDAVKSIKVTFAAGGEEVGLMLATPKDFSTGSKGFHASGKVQIGDKSYQTQVQLVEIGSKPKEEKSSKK